MKTTPPYVHLTLGKLNDIWNFPVDNKFAQLVLSDQTDGSLFPSSPARLCGKCRCLVLTEPRFRFSDTWQELEKSRADCDFCSMRWDICEDVDRTRMFDEFKFEREGSVLKLNGGHPPVLSICRNNDGKSES